MNKHLWDEEHPYYMQEGCYFSRACHSELSSFEEFLAEWEDADDCYNRIHRWDFDVNPETGKPEILKIYYVMQRKAYTYSVYVKINGDDEQKIINFLRPHAEKTTQLWKWFFETSRSFKV